MYVISNIELCEPCNTVLQHDWSGDKGIHKTSQSFLAAVDKGCYFCQRLICQLPEEWRLVLRTKSPAPKKGKLDKQSQWFTIYSSPPETRMLGSMRLNLRNVGPKTDASWRPRTPGFAIYTMKVKSESQAMSASFLSTVTSTSTNSAETFAKIQAWLKRCENEHGQCGYRRQKADPKWHPTRLVEILAKHENVTDASDLTCRIVELKPDETVKYVTLSHRWPEGDQEIRQIQKLTKAKLPQWKIALPVNALRKVFQDAFVVAHNVDISYIWIDTLCIIQGDEEDWNREAPTMHEVYSNAAFNICASRRNKTEESEGLFSPRQPWTFQPLPSKMFDRDDFEDDNDYEWNGRSWFRSIRDGQNSNRGGHYLIREYDFMNIWDRVARFSPLASRGWVFQEQLLSRANVHFGDGEVVFECLRMRASETWGSDEDFETLWGWDRKSKFLKFLLPIPTAGQEGPVASDYHFDKYEDDYEHWHDLLSRYTALRLTKSGDRLVAMSGVAQYFKELFSLTQRDVYVVGLWKSRLATQLLWESDRSSGTHSADWKDRGEPRCHLSFSWASVAGRIRKNLDKHLPNGDRYKAHALADMELIQYRVSSDTTDFTVGDEKPVVEDIFSWSSTPAIELKLKGLLRPSVLRENDDPWSDSGMHLHVDGWWSRGDTSFDFCIDSSDLEALNNSGRLFSMPLVQFNSTIWLLLLEYVETKDKVKMGRFRRIGLHTKHATSLDKRLEETVKEYGSSGNPSLRREIFKMTMSPFVIGPSEWITPETYAYLDCHDDFSALPCWQYDESSKQHTIFII